MVGMWCGKVGRASLIVAILALTLVGTAWGSPSESNSRRTVNPTPSPQPKSQDGKAEKEPSVVQENRVTKSKVEILGGTLRRLLRKLKEGSDPRVELVFLVDSSASVGAENFFNEIRFVRKLLSDFTVTSDAVRVALVTFSSRNRIVRHIDHLNPKSSGLKHHKCSLIQEELPRITYTGGGTYTLGAMLEAEAVLRHARRGARRVVFLITDGYSNGGDPRPVAQRLKEMRSGRGQRKGSEDGAENLEEGNEGKGKKSNKNNRGVEIFTFGIRNGNTEELLAMATDKDHTFILGSFKEFEALGRRAFHQDLQIGTFLSLNNTSCNKLCILEKSGGNKQCCDAIAECACGTISGHYACVCPPGYYGSGLRNDCHPCPLGTFNPGGHPGDVHTSCRRCPDPNQTTKRVGATSPDECECEHGFVPDARGLKCTAISCPPLHPPENGYFARTISGKRSGRRRVGRASKDKGVNLNKRPQEGNRESCPSLTFKSSCGVRCRAGFTLIGSHIRTCGPNGHWTGHEASCVIKKCPSLRQPKDGIIHCEEKQGLYKGNMTTQQGPSEGYLPNTVCHFECNHGFHLVGSEKRTCLPTGIWDGLQAYCKAKTCPPLQLLPHGKVFPPSCTSRQQLSPSVTSCLLVCDPGYILWGVRERLEWETNQGKVVCGPEGNWELTNPEIGTAKEALAWQRGKWMGGRCVDVEPPTVQCPNNISVETENDKKFANVHWDQPEAFDNSGIPVTINIVPAISWPAKLPIGDNEITIVGRDANRNKAKCKFTITVIDAQPPTIHMCETPPPFVLPSEPSVIIAETGSQKPLVAHGLTWNQPVFEDNSGLDLRVEVKAYISSLIEPTVWEGLEGGQGETFPIGDTVIHYTVFDPFGNNNTCEIIISVKDHACPLLPDPINGNSNCSKGREMDSTSLLCTLTCSDGYAFPVATPQEYFCSSPMEMTISETVEIGFNKWGHHDSPKTAMAVSEVGHSDFLSWEPQETLPFTDCMVAAIPNTLHQDGLIFMDGDNSICNDSAFYQQVEESVRRKISEKLAEICGIGLVGIQCEIVGEIEQVCESLVSTAEEEVNVVMASSVQRNDETHGKGKDGSKARKGRRNGGKGLRRKRLQDEVKRKRRGEHDGKDREQRRRGKKREQRGRRKDGMKKKPKEVGKDAKKAEDLLHVEGETGEARMFQGNGREISSETMRRKRSFEETTSRESFEYISSEDERGDDEDDDYETEEKDTGRPSGQNNGIGIYFKMVGPVKNSSNINRSDEEVALMNALEKVKKALEEAIRKGEFDIEVPIIRNVSSDGDLKVVKKKFTSSIAFEQPRLGCDKGSVLNNNLCVKCPSGTYWNKMDEECELCEKGKYQPLEGQSFCHTCPEGFSTNVGTGKRSRRRATSLNDCIPECLPGTYSTDGMVPCFTCPKGYYMQLNGAQNCTLCPKNKTSIGRGAKNPDDCIDICPLNEISETGVLPCYPCPKGYVQSNPGKTFCQKNQQFEEDRLVQNNTLIDELVGIDVDKNPEILPYNDCFTSPCNNGGTCYVLSNSGFVCGCALGYIGTFCELEENMCASDPCLNDGNCSSDGTSYTCSCHEEFTGLNCEVKSDACTPNPCSNGGICSATEFEYECHCPADFEGIRCEINVCDTPPCHTNDTCVYNGEEWECLCGSDSEDECIAEGLKLIDDEPGMDEDDFLDSDSVLYFPQSGTTNYILLHGYTEKNYSRISLCGWMNSNDRSNYGTIFSLASTESDNAFTLKDYTGFVVYVNGSSAATDISANDGKWHHFCLSWTSQGGNWNLFQDGILAAKGENLSPGFAIPGQATIVLGQEQDWEGGGFSEAESFVGRLALVTLENKFITAEEALLRATYCKSGNKESMIWSWADFLAERQGKIVVEESQLCKKCPKPLPPKNGQVSFLEKEMGSERDDSINGLTIKYSCQNSFTLTKGQEIRICLNNGTWDGKQPTCKRLSCDALESESYFGTSKDNNTILPIKCKGKKKVENLYQGVNKTDAAGYISVGVRNEESPPSTTDFPIDSIDDKVLTKNVSVSQMNYNISEGSNKEEVNEVKEVKLQNQDSLSKCVGPFGTGRIHEWTSYGEAHGLEGSQIGPRRGLFSVGSKVDVECDDGFELKGASHIVCGNGGKWRKRITVVALKDEDNVDHKQENDDAEGEEVTLPRCVPVICGPPPDINQGAWEIMERKHWNGGEGLRWNKVWDERTSGRDYISSDKILEGRPEDLLPHSSAGDGEEFKYGDVAEYDCEYGYALIGPQALHCSQNGKWVWSSRHSRWPGLEYAPRHYPVDKWPHDRNSQNLLSKGLEPRPPDCLPVRCPTPPLPLNGGFVERKMTSDPKARNKHLEHPEAYYVGDEVLNSCSAKNESSTSSKRRRQLIGPRLRRCLPSGRWSSYRPRCKD